jgi:hypothetical protein
MNEIVRIKFGSHLYGTNTPSSDVDYKAVHIPPASDILLQRVRESIKTGPSKGEGEKNNPGDIDCESYSLQRFLQLLAKGETGPIDMLFAPNPEKKTHIWKEIISNRHRLLTKKSAAFVGYCRTQANKYGIKGSRVAAAKAAMEAFTSISKWGFALHKVGEFTEHLPTGEHSQTVVKETTPGKFETYYECCNRMVGFKNTIKEAAKIFTTIYEEYGHRARLAESNEGIDWKALSHAVRVGDEAIELLMTHKVTFPLVRAEHIKQIKLGQIPYKQVAEEIEEFLLKVEKASELSDMREEPDYQWIDEFVEKIYAKVVYDKYVGFEEYGNN